jgi:hypothetical protein
MKLKPLREKPPAGYPTAVRRALGGVFVAASMTATSLGGCGPGLDSRDLDTALDEQTIDETTDDCNAETDPECGTSDTTTP